MTADRATLTEGNASLQARMVQLCAEENAARITAPLRGLPADEKKLLGDRPKTPEGQMARFFVEQAAALDDADYETARKNLAKNAGVRASILDRERARLRHPGDGLQGADVLFNEPEPWPSPVDGSAVLADVARILAGYVHLPNGAATAISLWVAAAHAFEAFQHAPRLNVMAATRGCGKTLLLDALSTLAPRALRLENLTQAVLFRIAAAHKPTLLVDECDRHLKQNHELIGLLNAGFTRGGVVPRCEGDDNKVRLFPVFAPVALSGIGELPGTLHDRSIVIRLERARPSEIGRRFDSRRTEAETALKRRLMRWCADNASALADADPVMPQAFNRVADVWRPLFAVAEVAGGGWPARCAKAFARLQRPDADAEPVAVQLLQDAAAEMDKVGAESMPSAGMVERLSLLEERPWPTWNHGKPISARQVARMLAGFGIHSAPRRVGDAVFRGYHRADFSDSLARYISSVTTLQAAPAVASSDFLSVTTKNAVTDEKPREAAPSLGCNVVTDKTGGLEL